MTTRAHGAEDNSTELRRSPRPKGTVTVSDKLGLRTVEVEAGQTLALREGIWRPGGGGRTRETTLRLSDAVEPKLSIRSIGPIVVNGVRVGTAVEADPGAVCEVSETQLVLLGTRSIGFAMLRGDLSALLAKWLSPTLRHGQFVLWRSGATRLSTRERQHELIAKRLGLYARGEWTPLGAGFGLAWVDGSISSGDLARCLESEFGELWSERVEQGARALGRLLDAVFPPRSEESLVTRSPATIALRVLLEGAVREGKAIGQFGPAGAGVSTWEKHVQRLGGMLSSEAELPVRIVLPEGTWRALDFDVLADVFVQRLSGVGVGNALRAPRPSSWRRFGEAVGSVRDLQVLTMLSVLSGDLSWHEDASVDAPRRLSTNKLRAVRDSAEYQSLASALLESKWNVAQAARRLDVPRRTLVSRMKKLGLKRPRRKSMT